MLQLLQRARRFKLAGATVFEAQQGFGTSRWLHETHVVSGDAPPSFVVVDAAERIDSFLDAVRDVLSEGAVLVEDIDVVET